ncbi:MAG: type II toxin-antitoxin system PemK/MazF family toxin [Campylobacterota bacterium]|nr:type II toxin-antitoxin system PemK/MazF family toxin [Campylobacterota bacterium]
MAIKKGEIYLANLGDVKCADIGKTRPVLIFQTQNLNRMVEDGLYDDVVVIPLSSQIKKSDFTYVLQKRDLLQKESTILCNTIKMIKASRLLKEHGVLTTLTQEEIKVVEKKVLLLLDIN